ncbi:MAG: ABC transporter ATP-binding protein [Treponema sp.]|jgi:simple sugar transport system ATP-binding protein|nr:ABC transporter ATP-binding protein [Treponema sp.]
MFYVEMRGVSKRFESVLANDNVNISVYKGEILSLLGENGSGKSTLVNILAGLYLPDSGTITIDGKLRNIRSPRDAIDAGIGMVHQDFKLIPVMNAWQNICMGERPETRRSFFNPFIEKKRVMKKIAEIGERFGLSTVLNKKVYDMSVGEKQNVEILKMLYRGANVLILDEPTAVLTPKEIRTLFAILRYMKRKGCAIIIITHKLNEVMEISDRVTVMRKGQVVAYVNTSEITQRELTSMMVGESVSLEIKRDKPIGHIPALEIKNLRYAGPDGKRILDGVSFNLYSGEILGVAGIAGNGQRELCEIITGMRRAHSGEIFFRGVSLIGLSPRQIKNHRIAMSFIPEDRLGMGLVGGMSIANNVLLRSYEDSPGFFVDRAKGNYLAEKIVKRFGISTPSVQHIVRKLSGGNIQKVLLGREVDRTPQVLVTAYPVRGLDIGASYATYDLLNEEKKNGVAILYIGEDLDVLMELCDRLMVIHAGKIMGITDPQKVTKEDIGLLMLGEKVELEWQA